MSKFSKELEQVDFDQMPRGLRRRAMRSLEKAALLDGEWFAKNPYRRTYVRPALPHEFLDEFPGSGWLAVVRLVEPGHYLKQFFRPTKGSLPDLSSEAGAAAMFEAFAQDTDEELDFDELKSWAEQKSVLWSNTGGMA
jgi:hypothetical protein